MDSRRYRRILVVTAVQAEQDAVLRGLQGDGRFTVIACGVGSAAAAAVTMSALLESEYDLVVSMGIGGGFTGVAQVGELVIASHIIAADLGAETADGFLSVDELGFGSSTIVADSEATTLIADSLRRNGQRVIVGPVLTVQTVTGTAETAAKMAMRATGAAAEAMEGHGVAVAASMHEPTIPIIEIRAISNAVGPRDRASWRIQEALQALEIAARHVSEVF